MAVYRARVLYNEDERNRLKRKAETYQTIDPASDGEVEFHAKGKFYALQRAMMELGVTDSSKIFVYRAGGRNNNGRHRVSVSRYIYHDPGSTRFY